ncbi:MAG: hypothetical protein PVG03_00875 [Desulfarculaceae bacterium]
MNKADGRLYVEMKIMSLKKLAFLALIALTVIFAARVCLADPCALVTKADAEKILGEAVKTPRKKMIKGMAAGQRCTYFTAAPMAKRGGVGTLEIVEYDPQTMAKESIMFKSPGKYFTRLYNTKKKAGAKLRDVQGLGNKAFWEPGLDAMHVMVKGTYFKVQVKDLVTVKGKTKSGVSRKVSAHRFKKAVQVYKQFILPRAK